MSRTLPALLRLAQVRWSRCALAAVLGALTVLFGVGLMATAGYLISRAAERPAILSLMKSSGLDFARVDMEHSAASIETIADMAVLARALDFPIGRATTA